MSKGKRLLLVEHGDVKVNPAVVEKNVYQILKLKGVKYSDTIEMYINLDINNVYCVVNNETIVIPLHEVCYGR